MNTKILWGVFACLMALLLACSDESSSFNATDVCPTDGYNAYGEPNRGTFIDERDGQEYMYTTIGDQVWMAQSLNYDFPEAVCYDSLPENCEKYGKMYWGMDIDSLCPAGWRLPSINDVEELMKSINDKHEVLLAGSWRNMNSTKINECGMSIYSAGENSRSENLNMGRRVSFWLDDLQESPLDRSYFYEDGYKISTYAAYPETTKKYVRCVKE
ncbi:MAG: hypothetical protein HUK21_06460 [Fibrobacteraceae bacterium]|nr:hypothetical protein [Fibrobacteraceae bacterium]